MSMPSKPFTVDEIREAYLAFFAAKGCVRYPSASLVPENDPTTLFTVAGMSQFKDMFLGRGSHPFTRATTAQKCIRTNDILRVGQTARHHTFFEMLGNFSFNDYFKREAINWAWEFLTKVLGLDPLRLSISVHKIDDEAYKIWNEEMGIPKERLFRLGDKDNFWPADAPTQGPEGPGGCCSEIFWDFRTNDDPNDNLTSDTGRFVEIWNLVFPQFNVRKPNADGTPNLENLGRSNIDTGMGLERLACVIQGVFNNFDTDHLQKIVSKVSAVAGVPYDTTVKTGLQAERNVLLRRIADHVRAVTFCITDGVVVGNTDRGYIVRRLIRRATLDADKLGITEAKLHEIVPAVVAAMGKAYPDMAARADLAATTLLAEEQMFRRTLRKGLELFQKAAERHAGKTVFSGDDAFQLVTTHGFPKETIAELLESRGLVIDEARYQVLWEEFQKISNANKSVEVFSTSAILEARTKLGATPFVGYRDLSVPTEITVLERAGVEVKTAAKGDQVRFTLAKTPFYGESGGQVGDTGTVTGGNGADTFTISVTDTRKDDGLVIHLGTVTAGTARPGAVVAAVDAARRADTTRHHSATHLLHAALARTLGDHIAQQGSQVSPEALRFDFNHSAPLSAAQKAEIEAWVNAQVKAALPVAVAELPIAKAKELGAKAQFGEKYGATVRVVTMGDAKIPASLEFCGGCHVTSTGDIRSFRIVKEENIAAGIRRIIAIAGNPAEARAAEEALIAGACAKLLGLDTVADSRVVEDLAVAFKVPGHELGELPIRLGQQVDEVRTLAARLGEAMPTFSGDLVGRVGQLAAALKKLRKAEESLAAKNAAGSADGLLDSAVDINGATLVAARIDGLDAKGMGSLAEALRAKKPGLVVVLLGESGGKAVVLAAVAKELLPRGLSAGGIVQKLAVTLGGRGGGKPDLAQGGGGDPAKIPEALAQIPGLVKAAFGGAAAG